LQALKHILAVLPDYSPSATINIITPLRHMHDRHMIQATIRLQNEVMPLEVAAADVLVLCRNAEPAFQGIFDLAQNLAVPMIYDLDDHLLVAPEGSTTYQYFQYPGRRQQLEWFLQTANLIRVHSPVLQEVMQPYNTNTRLVWAPINWSLVPPELPVLSLDPVHIVYAAQKETGLTLFRHLAADLHKTLEHYGDRVRLHFLGYAPPEFREHPLVVFQPFEADYAAYFSRFTRFGYAIGLAPTLNDIFHQSKTNVKFRDYAAAGAAGIYTDGPLYRNGVTDGETGLLVSGAPGSWFPAIQQLIDNPLLLDSIRQRARRYVEDRYNMERVASMWMEDFESMPARPPLSADQLTAIQTLRWPFTYTRKPDAPWVAALRKVLREVVPLRWKLRYYDTMHFLRRIRRAL
jgi:hypothetical protein